MTLFFKEIKKSKYLVTSIFALIVLSFSLISSSYAREYVEYIHSDGFQNAVAATDAEGDVLWTSHYQPFGEPVTAQWKNPNTEKGFSGHTYDKETELNDMGARFYDPVLGRFMSFDPVGFDPDSPMSFNRYAYANNNPYKYIDPNGESPVDLAFLVVDVAKLSTALYSGNIPAINSAAGDVLLSSIGVISPVPGTGQLLKAGKLIRSANIAQDIKWGAQVKHFPGHNSYISGRSILTSNPAKLAEKAGKGQQIGRLPVGQPGSKERIEFGEKIGTYIDQSGNASATTKGIIHYSKDGIHIIPARP